MESTRNSITSSVLGTNWIPRNSSLELSKPQGRRWTSCPLSISTQSGVLYHSLHRWSTLSGKGIEWQIQRGQRVDINFETGACLSLRSWQSEGLLQIQPNKGLLMKPTKKAHEALWSNEYKYTYAESSRREHSLVEGKPGLWKWRQRRWLTETLWWVCMRV